MYHHKTHLEDMLKIKKVRSN